MQYFYDLKNWYIKIGLQFKKEKKEEKRRRRST